MLKKLKYIAYASLFVMTITASAVVSIFSALNTELENALSLSYVRQRAEIVDGKTLNAAIKDTTYATANTTVTSIIFDDYSATADGYYRYIVDGVNLIEGTEPVSVASDGTDSINMFRVENSDETVSVYILSDAQICATGNMTYCFYNLTGLETLLFNNFDVSGVTNMFGFFQNCSSLTALDLSMFYTTSLTSCQVLFAGCTSLETLDISNFDTSKVINMSSMFNGCKALKGVLDLTHFNTENVTTFYCAFQNCNNVTEFVLTSFNTSSATIMNNMFAYCSSITTLDLTSFDTRYATDMHSMFYGAKSLETIKVGSNWDEDSKTINGDTRNVSTMYTNCPAGGVTVV